MVMSISGSNLNSMSPSKKSFGCSFCNLSIRLMPSRLAFPAPASGLVLASSSKYRTSYSVFVSPRSRFLLRG